MRSIGLRGAYGRDYTNIADIEQDLYEGKDFEVTDMGRGGYIDAAQLREHGFDQVTVRYARLTKVAVLTVPTTPCRCFIKHAVTAKEKRDAKKGLADILKHPPSESRNALEKLARAQLSSCPKGAHVDYHKSKPAK